MILQRALAATMLGLWALSSNGAVAQRQYPQKPVRIIVGFPAGTGTDVFVRIFADKLSEHFKQRFYVENQPGAAGNIASVTAANATPDGYTLFAATNANSIAVTLYKRLRYRFPDDFEPIALLATTPQVLVVNAASKINSLQDLVSAAKARPGEILYGTGGIGTGPHLASEMLSLLTGVKLRHVPYKGTTEAMSDLLTGRITMMFSSMPIVRSFVADGRLRVLAVANPTRLAMAPDIPTFAEIGVKGFDITQWAGLVAPKGTPTTVVQTLADGIDTVERDKDLKRRITEDGGQIASLSGGDFQRFIESDISNWAKAVQHSGLKID